MRELYYGDRNKYKHFAHVDVLFLPKCTEKDIDELEAELQMQPELKQDYSWITEACMFRVRQQKRGYSDKQLASIYHLTEKEIQIRLAELSLVDDYLGSRNIVKHYEVVENDEYAFQVLLRERQKCKRADEKDFFTNLAYCLIDDTDNIEGRLYKRIPEVNKSLEKIAKGLNEELQPEPVSPDSTKVKDLFGNVADDLYAPLINEIAKTENHESIIEVIKDVLDIEQINVRKDKKAKAVMKHLAEANSHLHNAISSISPESIKVGVDEQLIEIERSVKKIQEWLVKDVDH